MQRRFIKKADIALIAVILCVGAALLIWRFLPSGGKTEAVIYAGGAEYCRVPLDGGTDMTVTPETDPEVVIKIKDGAVWFESAAWRPAGVVIRLEGSKKRHDAMTGRICP